MTKILLATFIVAFIPFLSFSQTQVSGNIKKNTTWTKANSPYILAGTVGIPSAYTLTIEPGVEVQRTADNQILINGAVVINGTKKDSISFSSGDIINQSSKPFIEFQKSNLDSSSIRFVRFINQSVNGYNIRIGNESGEDQATVKNSGTLKIERSSLSNGHTAAKGDNAANSIDIDSCLIKAAYVQGYGTGESINISNSVLISSTIISQYVDYSGTKGINFNNCYLNSCSLPIGCCRSGFTFINSRLQDSKIAEYGNEADCVIKMFNSIAYNTSIKNPFGQFYIQNSKFIVTKRIYNLDGSEINYLMTVGGISIAHSELINYSVNSYSGMYLAGSRDRIFGNRDTITNNTFKNLYDAFYVSNFSSLGFVIRLDNNNFNGIKRYHIANYNVKDFSALNNYFYLRSGQTIDDVIFDSNDDLTYGFVTYTPYSTTPVETVPVSEPKNATKELSGNNVIIRWNKNTETNLKNYKVYSGYVDDFTYSDTTTVAPTDSVLVLTGASITDSIAVTASKVISAGRGNEEVVYESWFSPAVLRDIILPVRLLSFDAVGLSNKTQLFWQTSGEVFNDHFDVEYSSDGISFTGIGSVSATINSGNVSYSFLHNTPSQGLNYYRLKQVDKDGHFEYSNVVKVMLRVTKSVTIYPNPATETITIVSSEGISNASFINKLGQQIKKIKSDNSALLKVSIGDFPKGVYRVLITNRNQERDNVSFIKL